MSISAIGIQDIQLFFSTFFLIFLAELPDKTALSILVLSTRNHPGGVFAGAAVAFLIQSLVAVLFGELFSLLPAHWIHIGTGILFLIFSGVLFLKKEEKEEHQKKGHEKYFLSAAWTTFLVIFISEWGDLTQIASAALTAKYHAPLNIFLASTLALWSVTGLTVIVGNRLKKYINPKVIQKIAAFAFLAMGAGILIHSLLTL